MYGVMELSEDGFLVLEKSNNVKKVFEN